MKDYHITVPGDLQGKELEIKQFLLAQHWNDDIFRSGFCACLLGIERFDFQVEVLGKFDISFMGTGE